MENMKIERKPEWLKKKIELGANRSITTLLASLKVNTVCKEAKCPNISECFNKKHATFLILGKYCSRRCKFCNVEKHSPEAIDKDEPKRVALAAKALGLKHVVITSVTRDDLEDGGSSLFVETAKEIKSCLKNSTIEFLIPDFKGNELAIADIAKTEIDIIGHNLETVPRLYAFRPEADYLRSLSVLSLIKQNNDKVFTKSALLLGLGEKKEEVEKTLHDLISVKCDFLALGQYLRPSEKHARVAEYLTPDRFQEYKTLAIKMGFKHVESSPYTRSSWRADEYLRQG